MNQHPRLFKSIELAVSRGLATTLLDGVRAGMDQMKKENVPEDVIYRVLLSPSKRRETDWHH